MTLRHTLLILGSLTITSGAALGLAACRATPTPAAPTAVAARPGGFSRLATRKPDTVDMCHTEDFGVSGIYTLLTIDPFYEPPHLEHGDGHPGDCKNPGTSGEMQFTATCTLQLGCTGGIPGSSNTGSSGGGGGNSCNPDPGDSGSLGSQCGSSILQ